MLDVQVKGRGAHTVVRLSGLGWIVSTVQESGRFVWAHR